MTDLRELLERVELVRDPSYDHDCRTGRWNRTVPMRRYSVEIDGEHVGWVSRELATFERKTPGRMYVNLRWHSPRWFIREGTAITRQRLFYETRAEAVAALLRSLIAEQEPQP